MHVKDRAAEGHTPPDRGDPVLLVLLHVLFWPRSCFVSEALCAFVGTSLLLRCWVSFPGKLWIQM